MHCNDVNEPLVWGIIQGNIHLKFENAEVFNLPSGGGGGINLTEFTCSTRVIHNDYNSFTGFSQYNNFVETATLYILTTNQLPL